MQNLSQSCHLPSFAIIYVTYLALIAYYILFGSTVNGGVIIGKSKYELMFRPCINFSFDQCDDSE